MPIDSFVQSVIDALQSACLWFWGEVTGYVDATQKASFDYDFGVAFFIAAVIMFYLGSACWAASIAKCRRYNPILHFIAGLIIPWVYPLVILFALNIKGAKAMRIAMAEERKKADEEEAERQRNIALNSGKTVEELEAEKKVEEEDGWTQARFTKMARNDDGSQAGPWDVVYGGRKVHVIHIVEALPEVVSVEFKDEKGNMVRMRIPYAKIESWT